MLKGGRSPIGNRSIKANLAAAGLEATKGTY